MEAGERNPHPAWLARFRTARSAAIAGLVFAVMFAASMLLVRSAFPLDSFLDSTAMPSADAIDRGRLGLAFIPYLGIAFLWFTGALNYNFGHADNRLFTTVFTGSGVAFVVIIFVMGAVGAAELRVLAEGINPAGASRILPAATVNELLGSYAPRMAAVFALALSTLARLRHLLPTWLSIFGTLTGLVLLLIPFGAKYAEYLFPVWVTVLSIYLFVKDPGGKAQEADATR